MAEEEGQYTDIVLHGDGEDWWLTYTDLNSNPQEMGLDANNEEDAKFEALNALCLDEDFELEVQYE